MRTLCMFFEANSVAIACGASGHVMSAVFAANPIGHVLDRLAAMFAAYEPERVLLAGDSGTASAEVEEWLQDHARTVGRLPENAVDEIANALTMGAADLSIVDGPALFENCRPGEDMALAALELNHRLNDGSAQLLGGGVCI